MKNKKIGIILILFAVLLGIVGKNLFCRSMLAIYPSIYSIPCIYTLSTISIVLIIMGVVFLINKPKRKKG